MAQTAGIDLKRVSLLDVVNANESSQREVVSRITCVAKLAERVTSTGKATFLRGRYHQAMRRVAETGGGAAGALAGLLLAYPTCFVLQLEGAAHDITDLLRAIQADMAGLLITQMRVVSMTDDVPSRAYSDWHFAFAAGDAKDHSDAADAEGALSAASTLNLNFLGFAQTLKDLRGQELQEALDGIATFWEGLPPVELALSLLPFADAPTIQEFVDLFDGPVNIDLESERVWPMPKMPELQF